MSVVERLIEAGINRALRLDPDAVRRLGELDGKVILLEVAAEDGPLRFYVLPNADGLRVLRECDRMPDVTISGTPSVFLRQLTRGPSVSEALVIRGDIDLGQRFQRTLSQLRPDWEEGLAGFLGDIAAHQVARALRGLHEWGNRAAGTLGRDSAEYLKEEVFVVAQPERVQEFLREVDRLRADTDRLEKRVQRLAALV